MPAAKKPTRPPAKRKRRYTKRIGRDGWVRYEALNDEGQPVFLEFTKSYGVLKVSIHRSFPAENSKLPWVVHLTITGPRMSGSFDTQSVATLNVAMKIARAELKQIAEQVLLLLQVDNAHSPVLGANDGP